MSLNMSMLLCVLCHYVTSVHQAPGGTKKNLIREGSAPRSDPLPFIYHFWQKGTPFVYLPLENNERQFKYLNDISLPFHIPEAWKRSPFRAEPLRIGHYREYPPSPGTTLKTTDWTPHCLSTWSINVLWRTITRKPYKMPESTLWLTSIIPKCK